jgi:hypothetical protein
MKELKGLTPEQEALMPVVAKEYIDMFYSFKEIDKDAFEAGISWVYNDLLKKGMPSIVYLDSYKNLDTIIGEYKGKGGPVADSVSRVAHSAALCEVRGGAGSVVWSELGVKEDFLVFISVSSPVRSAVSRIFRDFAKTSSSYNISTYDSLQWVARNDYYQKTGLSLPKNFNKYKSLILSGVLQAYEYENVVFAIQPPVKWVRDARGRPNNPHGYAIEWADGFGIHCIDGVRIEDGLFNKIKGV